MHISNQIKAFDYMGSKFSVLPWLLQQFPEHEHYVSVFGGGATDLLNKIPSKIETYNDLNKKVVNFFSVLREKPDELIAALELTPHSRQEYEGAWYSDSDSDIEKARKFFVRTQQSLWSAGAQEKMKGWAMSIKDSRISMSEKTSKWLRGVSGLYPVVLRLRQVQIECRDFRHILKTCDTPSTFFYCDPPYDKEFRSSSLYELEFKNQDFHDLAWYTKNISGKIAISGYDSRLMRSIFGHLNFRKGPERNNNRAKVKHHECLWTNY